MPEPTLGILFITAEPEDQARPANTLELQTIQEALAASGAAIDVHHVFRATRKRVVRELQFDPDIAHFLCHGSEEGLMLEDDDGVTSLVDAAWLLDVFAGYPRLAVYIVRDLTIRPNASLAISGTDPCAIVAREQIRIYGGLHAAVTGNHESPGGFRSDGSDRPKGGGPGGGAPRSELQAGAGESFGGRGGAGVSGSSHLPPGASGPTYGTPELIPLIGGSAGGSGGSGGGALQLVAGHKLLVGLHGWISCGGAGGNASGPWHGYGGGYGGAVLIEAPLVEVAGTIAANGGGGSATWGGGKGKDGTVDANPTPGGYHLDPEGAAGGRGSGGREIDGEDGRRSSKSVASGGGGGAGRIRINTRTGGLIVTGTISPDLDTPCATLGKLNVRDPEPAPPPA